MILRSSTWRRREARRFYALAWAFMPLAGFFGALAGAACALGEGGGLEALACLAITACAVASYDHGEDLDPTRISRRQRRARRFITQTTRRARR